MTPSALDTPRPDDLEAAHRLIRALLETLRQQTHLNETLQHPREQLLRRLYGRQLLPANRPRRRVVHDVPLEERLCPDCGRERRCFGEEVREQLEEVPASMIVLQHTRPRYAREECQANVVIAERLPEPIEKGPPGPRLLAYVTVSKYADHLPLYCQEGISQRFGVDLSRSTAFARGGVSRDRQRRQRAGAAAGGAGTKEVVVRRR